MSWNRIGSILAAYRKREARARSVAARNREMKAMCALLGMEYKPMVDQCKASAHDGSFFAVTPVAER